MIALIYHQYLIELGLMVVQARRKSSQSKRSPTIHGGEACSAGDVKSDQSSGEATSVLSGVHLLSASPISQLHTVSTKSLSIFHGTASLDEVTLIRNEPMTSTRPEQADLSLSREASPPQSVSTRITVEQASRAGNAQPVDLDIQTQAVQCIPADGASNSSLSGTAGEVPSSWKTQFKMVIHLPKDGSKTRIAKLDTGSRVDVVSKPVADALGMKMEPYYGKDVVPLGGIMRPLGELTLDWHVMGKSITYTTTFLVLDSEEFDVLLSDETIGRIGFYTVNNVIWYLNKA